MLSGDHVIRVLEGSPDPFAVANRDQRAALSPFQSGAVLASHGAERATRRSFRVLDSARPARGLAGEFKEKVREEAAAMVGTSRRFLSRDNFGVAWWRVERRLVLGDAAPDDRDSPTFLCGSARTRSGPT